MKKKVTIIFVLISFSCILSAQFGANPFEASKADISVKTDLQKGLIVFNFVLPEDVHITSLANGFFTVELKKNPRFEIRQTIFPAATKYGDEDVFRGTFQVLVKLKSLSDAQEPEELEFIVGYQMCQEQPEEICFPPEEKSLSLAVPGDFKSAEPSAEEKAGPAEPGAEKNWMERVIYRELEKGSVLLFLLVFLAGFLTSLTPCVYPVIPIVMGYMGTRSQGKKLKGFYLSLFFVLGLSLVYAVFGVVAATTGSMMELSFQNPAMVIIVAAIFMLMGLSMAGVFDIPVPSSLSAKLQSGHKSEIIGALAIGGVSGVVAAPCVGPVLIALLSWISQTRNIFLGFWLTFVFSLGMGIIFVLAGTFSGVLASLPRGGRWMEKIKHFFAFMLMAGGVYLLTLITAGWADLVLWGVFLVVGSVFLGLFDQVDEVEVRSKLGKSVVLIVFLLGTFMLFKGLDTRFFKIPPAAEPAGVTELNWSGNLELGTKRALENKQIMMIDAYADWCAACKELENRTFSDPAVREKLKDLVLVRLDFTEKSIQNRELRKKLNIIGMPTIIFRDSSGSELARFSGFKNPESFMEFVNKAVPR